MSNYYADPTANTAIANVDRERRREERRRQEAGRRARQGTHTAGRKEDSRAVRNENR